MNLNLDISNKMSSQEGVVKFKQHFTEKLPPEYSSIRELNLWRRILFSLKLIGQSPDKYDGFAYGNMSQRIAPYKYPRNKRRFVITGTQTSGIENLTANHFATVLEYYPERNLVVSEGPIEASSEAMTHGAIYDIDDSIRFVFHVHSPLIWSNLERLSIPTTLEKIEYGTPEMAYEVRRLFMDTDVSKRHIFSMAGHKDGIISFGETSDEAGLILLNYFSKSLYRAIENHASQECWQLHS